MRNVGAALFPSFQTPLRETQEGQNHEQPFTIFGWPDPEPDPLPKPGAWFDFECSRPGLAFGPVWSRWLPQAIQTDPAAENNRRPSRSNDNLASAISCGGRATSPGAFTIGRAVTIANQATNGAYTIGGNTDNNSTFSGLVTVNKNLTMSQVTTTGSNALNITGGITGAGAGLKTVAFTGPGSINVNTTSIGDGATGSVGVSVMGGTVNFGLANLYSGGTTISGGTLRASNGTTGSATGTNPVTLSGGTLAGFVPEPSTWVLLALGGIGLWPIIRRKRSSNWWMNRSMG